MVDFTVKHLFEFVFMELRRVEHVRKHGMGHLRKAYLNDIIFCPFQIDFQLVCSLDGDIGITTPVGVKAFQLGPNGVGRHHVNRFSPLEVCPGWKRCPWRSARGYKLPTETSRCGIGNAS
jgi:hypothetical protein